MVITTNMVQTLGIAVVVLLIGRGLCNKVSLLNRFCIPAPVVGGLLFSIALLIGNVTGAFAIEMDLTLQSFFMNMFFTTVGFTASMQILKKGGLQVAIFLGAAIVLVILQNIVGVSLANVFDLNPLLGLATGSVPMTGGHGTSGAFGPVFEEYGAVGASTVALASATFGLIMGSMIGGPIARMLIEKYKLTPEKDAGSSSVEKHVDPDLKPSNVLNAFYMIAIALALGTIISMLIEMTGFTVPGYIGAMFVAAIIRNISDSSGGKLPVYMDEIGTLGDMFLSVFLAMALMSLKLWQLADLAGPLVIMLIAQTVLMVVFAIFVTFRVMGRDYEAAVITAGHCGFGMGATPNAMANMKAVRDKYWPAPKAFFILPIIGSLFIDFFNAAIITFFANMVR